MEVTLFSIEINTNIEKIYEVFADVFKWIEFLPPCKKVEILSHEGNVQIIELTAQVNEHEYTWKSERTFYPHVYRVDFRQPKPNSLLKSMQGRWQAIQLQTGVLLTLQHAFEVKDDVDGLVENVHTKEDALNYVKRGLEKNSLGELASIKKKLESSDLRKTEAIFEFDIDIQASAEQVYKLLYDVGNWANILPHCKEIKLLYEDGSNQEFEMNIVDAQGKSEIMRSIRHGYEDKMIEYFQPSPPPGMKKHTGKWIITSKGTGVNLKAWHGIELEEEEIKHILGDVELEKAMEMAIKIIEKNGMTTMKVIKSMLEGC